MKQMNLAKKALVVFAIVVLGMSVSACRYNGSTLQGNLSYTEEELKQKPFDKIVVDMVCNVYYTQNDGDKHDVRFDYSDVKDPELVQAMKEKVKAIYRNDGTIEIGVSGSIPGANNGDSMKRLKVYITSPDLLKVVQEGVGSFHSDLINSDLLTIDNEGVGSIYVKKILANKLAIDNEGVGSVEIDGVTGGNVNVVNEGVGSVKLGHFKGDTLVIDNEGVGKTTADVDCRYIKASLDGVGGVYLSGVAHQWDTTRDGVGKIHTKDLKKN